MDIRQIRDFVEVVHCGSFAAASRRLHISQPGLGYQIRELERDLGAELLTRHSRGVALTPAGALFLEHARAVLESIRKTRGAIAALVEARQREISIGLSPTPAQVLGPRLMELAGGAEGLKLRLSEAFSEELYANVASGALDFAVCLEDPTRQVRSIPLYREHLYLIGPMTSETSRRDDISLAELASYSIVTGPPTHVSRISLEKAAAERGVKLNVEQELHPGGLRRSLVVQKGRYTVSCFGIFADDIENGRLHARRIVDPEITMLVCGICSAALPATLESLIVSTIQSLISTMPMMGEPT